jgi:hypothetical protein
MVQGETVQSAANPHEAASIIFSISEGDAAGESLSTASGWHRKERIWISITLKAHGSSA